MDRNKEYLPNQPVQNREEDDDQDDSNTPRVSTLGEYTFPEEEYDLDDEAHRQQEERGS